MQKPAHRSGMEVDRVRKCQKPKHLFKLNNDNWQCWFRAPILTFKLMLCIHRRRNTRMVIRAQSDRNVQQAKG